MRYLTLCTVVLVLTLVSAAYARAAAQHSKRTTVTTRTLLRQTVRYQHATWHWQQLMGVRLTQTAGRSLAAVTDDVRVAVRDKWRHFAAQARARAHHPAHLRGWLCIHRHEAAWNDSGAPYYGGLQMDLGFQRHYGGSLLRRKGTADRWTPVEQMWVAERAHRAGRGFFPWPNTARACGLL